MILQQGCSYGQRALLIHPVFQRRDNPCCHACCPAARNTSPPHSSPHTHCNHRRPLIAARIWCTSLAKFEGQERKSPSTTLHHDSRPPHLHRTRRPATMDTNMEDVKMPEPMQLSSAPTSEPTTIPTLDGWIESLMSCKQLAESDVQRLCDKVRDPMTRQKKYRDRCSF